MAAAKRPGGPALLEAVACSWRQPGEAAAVIEYTRRLLQGPGGRDATSARDESGETALHILAGRAGADVADGARLAELVVLVGAAGADPDAVDHHGLRPLHRVAIAAAGALDQVRVSASIFAFIFSTL
jgi:hypothetical protein